MKTLSAFPTDPTSHNEFDTGMTLRDYFAAKAMQGMFDYWDENPHLDFEHIANCSYDMADAMMKARGE